MTLHREGRYTEGVRLRALPLFLSLSLILGSAPLAWASHAVPPVWQKKGPAPREGFSRSRLILPPPGRPGEGARAPLGQKLAMNVLAIRVSFSDTPIESSTAYYDRLLLFQKQYWEQMTDGATTLTHTLWDSVFTLPHPMAYYGDDDRFQERLVFMVRDLVKLADSTVDFRPYQSLVIFHAGAGQEADVRDDSREQIWSAFVTKEDFKTVLPDTTGSGAIGIKTNDPVGSTFAYINEAVELPELESQDNYVFGMTGVVCHEFGHQLGLPDLYDTDGDEGGFSQGIGSWDVMGNGVWNFNGFAPAGLTAWSRIFLGVLAPQRVITAQPCSLSMIMRQVGPHPRAIKIPMTETEYLLLENRKQDLNDNGDFDFDDQGTPGSFDFYTDSYAGAEWDFFLPGSGTGSGILAYHVDESVITAGLLDNVVNANAARKGIDLIEADGIEDLDGPPTSFSDSPDDVYRAGWRDALTPTTTPSTAAYGNVRTGISITGISAPDSIMGFTAAFERDKPGWPKLVSGRIRSAPSLAADVDGDGSRELLVPIQRLNNTGALYVFKADGTNFLGGGSAPVPFAPANAAVVTSPCVGDIDGVPGNEVVFVTANGTVYAFHANGAEVVDGDSNPATVGIVVLGASAGLRAQPVLAELDGNPGLEIVVGGPSNGIGISILRFISLSGGTVQQISMIVGGSSEGPPVVADFDGDGRNEMIATVRRTVGGENSAPGLYFVNWDTITDPLVVLNEPDEAGLFQIVPSGGNFTSPVAADLDLDGHPEVVVADSLARFHAFRVAIAPRGAGDRPNSFVSVSELTGWPAAFPGATTGPLSEIAVADLDLDGHPEVMQTGEDVRVAALYWTGAARSGYPLRPGTDLAPADSEGVWAPRVADVDGDGIRDVIPILPDGRRPAFRADGHRIAGFEELGSTGSSAPPILADLDGDGAAEWVETFDGTAEVQITVKAPAFTVPASSVAWGQYRLLETRNAVVAPGTASAPGTQVLADVYVYPNPSRNGTSRVHYRLDGAASAVSIRIFDVAGTLVADLPTTAADRLGSSEHAIVWDNRSIASGVYLCRVEVQSSGRSEVRFATLAIVR